MQHEPSHRSGACIAAICTRLVNGAGIWVRIRVMWLVFPACVMYQASMSDNTIENLAKNLADALPAGLKNMRDDLERNFRSVLRTGLGKLDLVTREEFDVQRAVLARTREKLEALEAALAEYEKQL